MKKKSIKKKLINTKGPWDVYEPEGLKIIYIDRQNAADIARIYLGNGLKYGVNKANALLIASAPDLFNITKKLADHSWSPDGQCLDKSDQLEVSRLIDALRDVIAKIEEKI